MRVKLDYDRGVPIYRQIYEAVVHGLSTGVLPAGEQLPTIHQLAAQLRVNPNTVARSYRDLERDGHIQAWRGRGTFPAERPATAPLARNRVLNELFHHAVQEGARHGVTAREIADHFGRAVDNET